MNYKLTIAYDGYFFSGYAKQCETINTIQSNLEAKLSQLFCEKIVTFASGRTDKYVHAFNQVISFKNKKILEAESIQKFLNNNLSHIYVKNVEYMDDSFNARFSAKSKSYLYIINMGEFNLFSQNYEWQYNKPIDLNKCNVAIKYFVGEKNFLSFSASNLENTIRKINFIKIYVYNQKLFFLINGTGFLRSMVRMIVATIINYCESKIEIADIENLFLNPKKGACISKAVGSGLYLYKVYY
ncbi:MAG: tRNA pseudouridine(38-40) synthase TruA [Malacoplasma sp.]|nr:tRNA pseudouridine(38-40) synthase TruA [Malacoplasma sp.]